MQCCYFVNSFVTCDFLKMLWSCMHYMFIVHVRLSYVINFYLLTYLSHVICVEMTNRAHYVMCDIRLERKSTTSGVAVLKWIWRKCMVHVRLLLSTRSRQRSPSVSTTSSAGQAPINFRWMPRKLRQWSVQLVDVNTSYHLLLCPLPAPPSFLWNPSGISASTSTQICLRGRTYKEQSHGALALCDNCARFH